MFGFSSRRPAISKYIATVTTTNIIKNFLGFVNLFRSFCRRSTRRAAAFACSTLVGAKPISCNRTNASSLTGSGQFAILSLPIYGVDGFVLKGGHECVLLSYDV